MGFKTFVTLGCQSFKMASFLTLIILTNLYFLTNAHPRSYWEPFCNETLLYQPYVRIWIGNTEPRRLIRDRGPGFMDVRDMRDIFVCTNGVVMFYYENTHAMGDVYEDSELRWAPHVCQLHNPTRGLGGTQPFKVLKAILLIGHPKDYRKPSLQMFVAPYYDKSEYLDAGVHGDVRHRGYVNLTSLLMINSQGECIIESGRDKALLRVQARRPDHSPPPPPDDIPTAFCHLDSSRRIGQKPPLATVDDMVGKKTGLFSRMGAVVTAEEANQRRTVVQLNVDDQSTKFKGCLPYPLFNEKLRDVIIKNYFIYAKMNETTPNGEWFLPVDKSDMFYPKVTQPFEPEYEFWDREVRGMTRRERFFQNNWRLVDGTGKTDEELETIWQESVDKVNEAKDQGSPDVEKLEEEEYKNYIMKELNPFLPDHKWVQNVLTIELQEVSKLWTELYNLLDKGLNANKVYDEYVMATKNLSLLRSQMVESPYDVNLKHEYESFEQIWTEKHDKLVNVSIEIGRKVSIVESLRSSYWRYLRALEKSLNRIERVISAAERREKVEPYQPLVIPKRDIVITMTNENSTDHSVCDELAPKKETCRKIKPSSERAGMLLESRKGKHPAWNNTEDEWRDEVFDLFSGIFSKACPYFPTTVDFVTSINNIIKGYLLSRPLSTGYEYVDLGGRLFEEGLAGKAYLEGIYNDTKAEMSPSLRPKRKFWDYIIMSLKTCREKVGAIEFTESTREGYNEDEQRLFLRKFYPNNNTYQLIDMDQLIMNEQAEREYVFNWAIDMNWKIFATVLGSCLPYFENNMALVYAKLYSMYTEDFLHPLRQIWMSGRDNVVFRFIHGDYYGTGRGNLWTKNCMEASFVNSGDVNYRPLRWLYVNQFSELNFFTTGPMTGKSGIYFE